MSSEVGGSSGARGDPTPCGNVRWESASLAPCSGPVSFIRNSGRAPFIMARRNGGVNRAAGDESQCQPAWRRTCRRNPWSIRILHGHPGQDAALLRFGAEFRQHWVVAGFHVFRAPLAAETTAQTRNDCTD
jgi:hypothetical protein